MAYPHLRGVINTLGERKSDFTSLPWPTETAIAAPSLTSSTKEIPCMSPIQDT